MHYKNKEKKLFKPREIDMVTMNGAEAMKSSSFASTTGRFVAGVHEKNPGPGTYDPQWSALESNDPDLMSKVGRDTPAPGALGGEKYAGTGRGVGPGTYDPQVQKNGELNTIQSRTERNANFGMWGWSASFVSESLRSLFV